ncbi:hypothetical protein Ahy_A05g025838 isoform B [Arachis hypogaea]|uniref:NAC domain-containing protein n=1 Tax=Arachis hypogaea TaxID=3818 RepID=A0A445D9N7_ARAHY|nr:hypothetical protein Ahy_A05g025838 isoform B [Arachis hypogaea]
MNAFSHVPPGFRFHPTDEELVDYYLRKKIASKRIDLDVIKDVDLYKIEPWDLQEICKIGSDDENEWYFFSHKDKKYPTGTRTNRATKAGFWKATGRDKAIYSSSSHCLVGMRKTLVFYKGRAPNGLKSNWIMHEYRLDSNQEDGWVVCRVFKKRMPTLRNVQQLHLLYGSNIEQAVVVDQVTDWRVLDKFVASQLMSQDQDQASKETCSMADEQHVATTVLPNGSTKQEMAPQDDYVSTSASSNCDIHLWN